MPTPLPPGASSADGPAAGANAFTPKEDLSRNAEQAADFLKMLASPPRLLLLCHVSDDEVSVGELSERTGMRMPTVSQHLGHLRAHGIVQTRRVGTTIYYRRNSEATEDIMNVLMKHFCKT